MSEPAAWALAIGAYLLSHLLRVVRLALLLLDSGRSLRELAGANFTAALAVALVPLRLGEVVRLAEYYRITGGRIAAALSTFLVERFFDASALLLLGLVAAAMAPAAPGGRNVVLVLVLVVWILFMVAYVSLPRTLHSMRLSLLRRGRGERSLRWLRWLGFIEDTWLATRVRVENRSALIWLVTMLIWFAELAAFAFAAAPGAVTAALAADFLAALQRGLALGAGAAIGERLNYNAVVLCSLGVTGVVAALFAARGWVLFLRERLRTRPARYHLL